MKKYKLRPYMISGGEPIDWAMLVFAHNVREAKVIGFPIFCEFDSGEWIDMQVKWLKNSDYLYKEADQDSLKRGYAHAVESPQTCKSCELWGYELDENGFCEGCRDNEKFNNKPNA